MTTEDHLANCLFKLAALNAMLEVAKDEQVSTIRHDVTMGLEAITRDVSRLASSLGWEASDENRLEVMRLVASLTAKTIAKPAYLDS